MRRLAWAMVLLYAFLVPWEYSLDLGSPWGNIARVAGLLLLLVAVPAVLEAGRWRSPGPLQWLTLALYLWFCASYFWTAAPIETQVKLRGYPQEMMIVWLVWEFGESLRDVRSLMRAWLAGSWVLAALTIANFISFEPGTASQIRFAAVGQDPNDVARFLDLGFPVASLLLDEKERWPGRLLAAGYLPIGFIGVVLTASRGGFLAGVVAIVGSSVLLILHYRKSLYWGLLALPPAAATIWLLVPHETLQRIASVSDQLRNGDLNQRINIWSVGWSAFYHAPLLGYGAGSFVTAARLAPTDTAHNTALSMVVEGGLIALFIATTVVAVTVRDVLALDGRLRTALATLMAVWLVSSLVGTVGENRLTWLVFAVVALSRRLIEERPECLEEEFPGFPRREELCVAERVL